MNKWIELVKAHQNIVLGLAALGVILYISSAFINRSADKATAVNLAAQQELQNQRATTEQLQKQVDAQTKLFQTAIDGLTKANDSLRSQIVTRDKAVGAQQKTDEELPPTLLAKRWETLVKLPPESIQSTANGYLVDHPSAVQTIQTLEILPAIQQDLTDTENIVRNKDTELAANHDLISAMKKETDQCRLQIAAEQKACLTSVNELKATSRKDKKNWFIRGIIVGGSLIAYVLH